MRNILGRMARATASFRPSSPSDILAILIARRLSDPAGIRFYSEACHTYPVGKMADAVGRALNGFQATAARHRVEGALVGNTILDGGVTPLTVGLKIERRILGAAVFRGARLIDSLRRHLPSARAGALSAMSSALTWLTEQYPEATIGLETLDLPDSRRAELIEQAKTMLREKGIALWEMTARELLESYGLPEAPARQNCRETAKLLWPTIATGASSELISDAALIGYAVQVRKCLAAADEHEEGRVP